MGSSVAGSGDVVGTVRRTSFTTGAPYSFGNPDVSINFASATTLPTEVTVTLSKTRPPGFTYAISRTYSIAQTNGSNFLATLRLHYLDGELNLANGATEGSLHLYKNVSGWTDQGKSANDAAANWVERSGINSFSEWTLSGNTPTAVTLTSLEMRPQSNDLWLGAGLLLGAVLMLIGWGMKRRRA